MFEDAAGITLRADMPGVPKDRLVLKIEGLEAVTAEVRVPRYRSSLTLSRELDTAHIPKQARAQSRRIAVISG